MLIRDSMDSGLTGTEGSSQNRVSIIVTKKEMYSDCPGKQMNPVIISIFVKQLAPDNGEHCQSC